MIMSYGPLFASCSVELVAAGEARFLEIGKYWEISAMELLARLNTKTTPMSLLDIY
jgi:hypothetical protein